ncbi:MAG: NAD(P)-binding domain-containing protein [Phycisphaerae bacterium]
MTDAEVAIIGAGPIGIELALSLKQKHVRYLHFEARQIGRTISNWPRFTRFLSSPDEIAIPGIPLHSPPQDRPTGEDYLAYLRTVVQHYDLPIRTFEPITNIKPLEGGRFELTSAPPGLPEQTHRVRRVVLAVGDMHRPARLEVPGADLPHVRHAYTDPHYYFGRKVLVVGGGNSAVEASQRLFRVGATVTLSSRGENVKQMSSHKIGPEVQVLIKKGLIEFLSRTAVVNITPEFAELAAVDESPEVADGPRTRVRCDAVLALIGYRADLTLFRQAGVEINPSGDPVLDRDTMETNVPGVYVVGTAAAGDMPGHTVFIETGHPHVTRVTEALLTSL